MHKIEIFPSGLRNMDGSWDINIILIFLNSFLHNSRVFKSSQFVEDKILHPRSPIYEPSSYQLTYWDVDAGCWPICSCWHTGHLFLQFATNLHNYILTDIGFFQSGEHFTILADDAIDFLFYVICDLPNL